MKDYIRKIFKYFKSITGKKMSNKNQSMIIEKHEIKQVLEYPDKKLERLLSCIGGLDIPIYKYMRLKHLLASLREGKLYIGKVNQWEDVYENFLFKQPLFIGNNPRQQVDWFAHTDGIYGQCWTTVRSSDAMWRIYSEVKDIENVAIRLQTTPRKLWDALYISDMSMADTSIGYVRYLDDLQLSDWLNSNKQLSLAQLQNIFFESLLIKRVPFNHEHELRILRMLDSHTDHPDLLSYSITPDNFFDELVIDPRLTRDKVQEIERRISQLNHNVSVRQSRLYQFLHRVDMTIN